MSATDELRRMLNERGIQYQTHDAIEHGTMWVWVTYYIARDGNHVMVSQSEASDYLRVFGNYLTAEQAIECTLGRGECHPIISDNLAESEGTGDAWADCSECGHLLFVLTDPNSEVPHYCPNCGRLVVA